MEELCIYQILDQSGDDDGDGAGEVLEVQDVHRPDQDLGLREGG